MQITKIRIAPRDISKIPAYFQDSDGFYSLDLYERPKIALTYQDDTIADGSIDGKGINRSYHINVPFTPKNDLLLENIKSANVVNTRFQTGDFVFAKVLVGSDVVLDGLLTITNIDKLIYDKTGDYEIFVFGNERNWIDILKNTNLNELSFSDFDFYENTTLALLQQLEPKHTPKGVNDKDRYYLAPIFSGKLKKQIYDDPATYNDFTKEDLSITIWLGYIIELMEKVLPGYRFQSQLLHDDSFKKKTLHCLENFRQPEELVLINQLRLGFDTIHTESVTLSNNQQILFNNYLPFQNESLDSNNLYQNGQITIKDTGKYKFEQRFHIIIEDDIHPNINAGNLLVDIQFIKNGSTIIHQESQTAAFPPSGVNFNIDTLFEYSLYENDIITINLNLQISGNSPGAYDIRFQTDTELSMVLLKDIINMTINPSDYIDSRLSCWNIFNDVLTLYNCSLRTDYDLKIIHFDTPNQFYKPNHQSIDWTNKLDASKKIKTAVASGVRYAMFHYVNDSGDKYYNRELSGGRLPLYDFEYDFEQLGVKRLNGEQKIQLSVISATKSLKIANNTEFPCVTENEIFKGEIDAVGPFYYKIEAEAERTYKFNPRLFHVAGWGKLNGQNANWIYDNVSYEEIPLVWFVNRLESDVEQLSGESMLLTYWQQTLVKINLNGLTTAYFVLSVADIKSIDTSIKIKLLNDFYYLKKVLNWLANNPDVPTQVTLLLDDSVKVVRHSEFETIGTGGTLNGNPVV